jgi:hypothetical protein
MGFIRFVGWLVVPYIMLFIRWNKMGKARRFFAIPWAVIALIIGISIASSSGNTSDTLTANAPVNNEQKEADKTPKATQQASDKSAEKTKADAEAKAAKEAEAKAKEESATKEKEEKIKNPNWNKNDVDATKNGNIKLAVDMLKAMKVMPSGEAVASENVIKTPWNYYGKPITFTGEVAVVQDYPPGSDLGKAGLVADIVIETDDGTIVEFFSMVPSGNVKVGQDVTITGYPVGRTEVKNAVGGSFTHLIVITNKLQ